jgi:hypothetical protein
MNNYMRLVCTNSGNCRTQVDAVEILRVMLTQSEQGNAHIWTWTHAKFWQQHSIQHAAMTHQLVSENVSQIQHILLTLKHHVKHNTQG